jgi:hypothetical protein
MEDTPCSVIFCRFPTADTDEVHLPGHFAHRHILVPATIGRRSKQQTMFSVAFDGQAVVAGPTTELVKVVHVVHI